jgi:hypothetical protein
LNEETEMKEKTEAIWATPFILVRHDQPARFRGNAA